MCGICGVVQERPDDITLAVRAQLDSQRHRGPNAEGFFDGGRGVVAQNRLSIIDLVTGDPPVTNEDESIGAVLNGEIYNFQVLREQLTRDGHVLSTAGDTEFWPTSPSAQPAPSSPKRLMECSLLPCGTSGASGC